jgi:hypothetical protein
MIQKIHTTVSEHVAHDELLLSTFCAEDLAWGGLSETRGLSGDTPVVKLGL